MQNLAATSLYALLAVVQDGLSIYHTKYWKTTFLALTRLS